MSLKITMYTDGASKGNPGPGGFGTILIFDKFKKEISEGYKLTTNNRMELLAVISGLEALKFENCDVTIYSDSKYVVDSVTKKWLDSWLKNRFKGKKNKDLWLKYVEAAKKHKITFVWVKGHAGNPFNERCDTLAVEAANKDVLLNDFGYEE